MPIQLKATPRAILNGIRDVSPAQLPLVLEQLPQNLPLIPLLTERGRKVQLVTDNATALLGSKTFDRASIYFNHGTVMANTFIGVGNAIYVHRLEPTGSGTAMLRISLELAASLIPVYARNIDGTIQYSPSTEIGVLGSPIISQTIVGTRVIPHTTRAPYDQGPFDYTGFGEGVVINAFRNGNVVGLNDQPIGEVDEASYTSTVLYPILDLEVGSFGEYGNNIGVSIKPILSTGETSNPTLVSIAESLRTMLYQITVYELNGDTGTPIIQYTLDGDVGVVGSLREVRNPIDNSDLALKNTLVPSYTNEEEGDQAALPPFGRIFIYEDNIDQVVTKLTQGYQVFATNGPVSVLGEKDFDADAIDFGRTANLAFENVANRYLFNIFTGVDQNNIPYFASDFDNAYTYGGVALTNGAIVYSSGGDNGLHVMSDGRPYELANLSIYENLVFELMDTFGADLDIPYLDMAKYPLSTIWDSGFSLRTKLKLLVPMSKRKDIVTILGTRAVLQYIPPTNFGDGEPVFDPPTSTYFEGWSYETDLGTSEEISRALFMRTASEAYPESVLFGTSVCRAIIVGQSGLMINNSYRHRLPLTHDVAFKVGRYMGASNGRWTSGRDFDESPGNQVTQMRAISNTYRTDTSADRSWDAGLVYTQNYSRNAYFYPAFQTVYTDDTSILNAFVVVMAAAYLEKIAASVWRDLTGNTRLTSDQFIEKSDRLIVERTNGIFDGRFTVTARTYFTNADEARGYSWSTDITLYANTLQTVGTYTIVARRLSELTAG